MMDHNDKFRNDLREAYNNHALERESGPLEDWKAAERAKFLARLLGGDKKKLLEIGAGHGRDGKFFQDQGLDVTCIDLSPVMVDLCRQKGLVARVMDVTRIDFPDHSFDAVYAMNSLLHITKQEFTQTLQRIDALLRADGIVFIGMHGGFERESIWEGDAYTPKRFFSMFTDEHLQQEAAGVFDILSFTPIITGPDDPPHFQSLMLKKKSHVIDRNVLCHNSM
jgi:SAM-dependent methyltransferase